MRRLIIIVLTCILLLEGMAAQKAVIVSETSAIRHGYGLVDGENCILVRPGDQDALVSAIQDLANHPEKAEAIGKAARDHVLRFHDIKRFAQDLAGIFQEVLT